MDAPPSRKHAKAPESVAEQRFPARIVSSHAGGHWFESSSLHHEKTLETLCFQGFSRFWWNFQCLCVTDTLLPCVFECCLVLGLKLY